jgi:hypothetical protein
MDLDHVRSEIDRFGRSRLPIHWIALGPTAAPSRAGGARVDGQLRHSWDRLPEGDAQASEGRNPKRAAVSPDLAMPFGAPRKLP